MKRKPRKGEQFSVGFSDLQVAQCVRCKHLLSNARCAAFPEGIPADILENRHDHRRPYPGDNGIRFESEEQAAPAAVSA